MPFTLSISPTSGTGNRNYTVTITSQGGFAGAVSLTCALAPAASCSISPPSVALNAGGTETATCSVGNVIEASTLTITGTGMEGGAPVSASVTASIAPGSFTVALSPSSGNGNATYDVTVTSVNYFAGTVTLSSSLSPFGSCSVAPSVTLAPNGSQSVLCSVGNVIQGSILTVTGSCAQGSATITSSAAASIAAGNFTVALTPTTGTGNRTYTMSCGLSPSGSCSVSPSVTLTPGGTDNATCTVGNVIQSSTLTVTATYTQGGATITSCAVASITPGSFEVTVSAGSYDVTVASRNSFAGTVNLMSSMSPSGTSSVSPPSVTLSSNGTEEAECQVGAGPATLTVTGTHSQGSTTITHSDTATVT
jgi:hypothetical protein